MEETRQLNKRIQELEINNINHRITALETSHQNIGYIQQQYRPPYYIRPPEHPWNSRFHPTNHKTDDQNASKESPTQRPTANWTIAFPPKTKEVNRATHKNATRDQVEASCDPKGLTQCLPHQGEMINNHKTEIQNNELTLNKTQEIIHDSDIELQTSYGELTDLDQTINKSCRKSPKNSVLESSRSYLNTPQLSPQSNNNLSTNTHDHVENLVNSILDFNHCKKPRGYGGTAVVRSNKIDHIVDDTIQDGSERIVCIKIDTAPTPIIVVSTYMPCRGNRKTDDEFSECLDMLYEITRKYHSDHRIILCGD
ncbi:unnamed protein product [Mytilus edulis]|uniref:Uncharacterized protein n=1 Tax=Mytilus edulis TaxID=6550 RepID=A0A8S3U9T3_MYTED|nr:unnamed protein product [Mytilus edulis]